MASDYLVQVQCPVCMEQAHVIVPLDGYLKWQDGELIQNAMPTISADDRERLITGICKPCWDNEFGVANYPDGSQEQYDSWDEE